MFAPCLSNWLNECTAMGQKPTEEELFQMISEVDDNMSGTIGLFYCGLGNSIVTLAADFGEFLKVIEKQKERAAKFDDESDMSKQYEYLTFCSVVT